MRRNQLIISALFILAIVTFLFFLGEKPLPKPQVFPLVVTLPATSEPKDVVDGDTTSMPHLSDVDCRFIRTFEQYYDIRHDLENELFSIVTAETVEYENNLRELSESIQDQKKSVIQKLRVEYPRLYIKWTEANTAGNFIEKERIEKLPELRDFVLKMLLYTENYHIVSQIFLTRHNEIIRSINEEYTKKEGDAYNAYISSERESYVGELPTK